MLADTIVSIRRAHQLALRRRKARDTRRHPISLVDRWLSEVETLLEQNHQVVPMPLITEIAGFLRLLDGRLYQRLRSNDKRDSLQVLGVLFEAEEQLLRELALTA